MFCTHCGTGEQDGKFCSKCGGALETRAHAVSPVVNNKVDVTVNVGSPVLIAKKRGASNLGAIPAKSVRTGEPWYTTTLAIVLALVLFFPVGLALLWKSDWKEDTKWSVSGVFLWPLWVRFVLRQYWPSVLKVLVSAVLVLGYAALFTRLSGVALLLIGLPTFIWTLWLAQGARDRLPAASPASEAAQVTLDRCHDVIAEIESTIALDLLPPAKSWLQDRYIRALEVRQEADKLLGSDGSAAGCEAAKEKAELALSMLIQVREALPAAREASPAG